MPDALRPQNAARALSGAALSADRSLAAFILADRQRRAEIAAARAEIKAADRAAGRDAA